MVEFWAAALALSLLLYVLLDGFDLGVGMLYPFAPGERARAQLLSSISPVWDGNETWLVLAAATLFGAFPLVYSIAISAFYLPIQLMLVSLILRGVAFEFRYKAGPTMARVWDAGFVGGSYLATFIQGVTVGAFVAELPIEGGRFVGGPFFWLQPLALACGVGLCLGYAMMGSCWVIGKTEGRTRDFAYRVLPWLATALLAFLATSFVISLHRHLQVMDRWIERPALIAFPFAGLLAGAGIAWGWKARRDRLLFPCGAVIFASAFGTLAASFLPYMVPFTITVEQGAAPLSSLTFMFWGAGVIVLPLTLAYTAAVYFIFRGRVGDGDGYAGGGQAPEPAVASAAPAIAAERSGTPVLTAVAGFLVMLGIRSLLRRLTR
ncbi:cytochrome d ubiquinol oxidase subunit II [Lichenifustis flavocetrariae]|uniref:Cytochrome d ubiquinol oxidase subunit II n=1 Tax=Lichenifustis flavocetrariae TaxID=2949735 RepID=A0AA41Z0H6_9HYPH|nr:cytochrome d ubiquinol oxidase subunit II [Lichenifustis flavocetrariae]MCW6511514.1 cytochrome d ubiquinol oxidase subunit II [Lichenifustis flavocetrariae]